MTEPGQQDPGAPAPQPEPQQAAPVAPAPAADATPAPGPDAPLFREPVMEAVTAGRGPEDVKTLDRHDR